MIEYGITVSGVDEQLARLRAYDEIADHHLMRAMSDSVKAVARVTRSLAPVGATGQLRAGVDHQLIAGREDILGRVVDRAYYGLWVEFGTVRARGRHFMWRAYLHTKRLILHAFGQALERITKELAGGGRASG
jgi:HK97 gp10 family phage protein